MQLQRPALVQEQRQKMNPQLLQSLKLMVLPVADLRERIELELEMNPALEVIQDRSTVQLEDTESQRKEEYEYFESTSDPGRILSKEASDEHQKFIEGTLIRPETLQEHLLWQLSLEPIDEELRLIAETLIQNLDNDGFHKEDIQTLFTGILPGKLQNAVNLVSSFDPPGTCTANYRESLMVQINLKKDAPFGIEKALDKLELFEKGKFSAIARHIGLTEKQVHVIYDYLKKLSPFPGRAYSPAEVRYVIPDVRVIRDDNGFVIKLNDEAFPVLGVNNFLEEIGKSNINDAKEFARENVREARLFIHHLKRRNKTLIRVVKAVIEFQRPFFTDGPKYLSPLTLSDIARELNMHEATVSRTANGKYIQTEWGIFEIRHFFTNSISGTGSSGSRYSKEGVKEIIREIISGENNVLSDNQISELLHQKGIALARRTVAKYRKELDMGSSYNRRV
jgi:RNA polymerase sigma-54 factor